MRDHFLCYSIKCRRANHSSTKLFVNFIIIKLLNFFFHYVNNFFQMIMIFLIQDFVIDASNLVLLNHSYRINPFSESQFHNIESLTDEIIILCTLRPTEQLTFSSKIPFFRNFYINNVICYSLLLNNYQYVLIDLNEILI